jgi:hypothetical protein
MNPRQTVNLDGNHGHVHVETGEVEPAGGRLDADSVGCKLAEGAIPDAGCLIQNVREGDDLTGLHGETTTPSQLGLSVISVQKRKERRNQKKKMKKKLKDILQEESEIRRITRLTLDDEHAKKKERSVKESYELDVRGKAKISQSHRVPDPIHQLFDLPSSTF